MIVQISQYQIIITYAYSNYNYILQLYIHILFNTTVTANQIITENSMKKNHLST